MRRSGFFRGQSTSKHSVLALPETWALRERFSGRWRQLLEGFAGGRICGMPPLPFDSELIGWLADPADASTAAFWEVLACLRRTRGQGASADPNSDAAADVG